MLLEKLTSLFTGPSNYKKCANYNHTYIHMSRCNHFFSSCSSRSSLKIHPSFVSCGRCANSVCPPLSSAAVCPSPISSAFLSGPSPSDATLSSSSSPRPGALAVEQTQPPVTGTRKAKVLYDYDAHDSSELSLLADEVQWHSLSPHLLVSLFYIVKCPTVWSLTGGKSKSGRSQTE